MQTIVDRRNERTDCYGLWPLRSAWSLVPLGDCAYLCHLALSLKDFERLNFFKRRSLYLALLSHSFEW